MVPSSQSGPLLTAHSPTPPHHASCYADLISSVFRVLSGFKCLSSFGAFPHAVPLARNTLPAPFTCPDLPILQVSTQMPLLPGTLSPTLMRYEVPPT